MIRIRQLFAVLVVLALAWGMLPSGMARPTALLAAPAPQGDAPVLLGEFRSDVLPAADAPGLVVTLRLYDDGSAEVLSDYLNDADPIVEIGDWVENTDGTVTLTVTGSTEMDYTQPVALTFVVDEAGALVVPGAPDGPFGEAGLRLAPALPDAPDYSNVPADAQVFQSAVIPAASGPGFQLTLLLYGDGTLDMVSDYLQPGEYVVEVGEWDVDDDGTLLITLTGQSNRAYDQPVEIAFTLGDDGTLLLVDEGGLFGDEGLRLDPIDVSDLPGAPSADATPVAEEEPTATPVPTEEAVEEATPAATEEPVEEATPVPAEEPEPTATPVPEEEGTDEATGTDDAEVTEDVAAPVDRGEGVAYTSLLVPTDDGDALVMVALFFENGDAFFTTYTLDGELPVLEIATWELDDSGAELLFTFLGTPAEAYEEPYTITAQLLDDDVVQLGDITLYPVESLSPPAQDEAAAAEPIARFVSGERPAASGPGLTITLDLYADFRAEFISDYGDGDVVTALGEWDFGDDETLAVMLTGQTDGETEQVYDEPRVFLFAINDDDTLTLINDEDGALFGEAGLTLTAVDLDAAGISDVSELDVPPLAELDLQLFQSDVLPSASSPGLRLTLGLADSGEAILEYDYLNPGEVVSNFGVWSENADGSLTVTLDEGPSGPFAEPDVLTLELDADGNFVIVEAGETVFGLVGVVLTPLADVE